MVLADNDFDLCYYLELSPSWRLEHSSLSSGHRLRSTTASISQLKARTWVANILKKSRALCDHSECLVTSHLVQLTIGLNDICNLHALYL